MIHLMYLVVELIGNLDINETWKITKLFLKNKIMSAYLDIRAYACSLSDNDKNPFSCATTLVFMPSSPNFICWYTHFPKIVSVFMLSSSNSHLFLLSSPQMSPVFMPSSSKFPIFISISRLPNVGCFITKLSQLLPVFRPVFPCFPGLLFACFVRRGGLLGVLFTTLSSDDGCFFFSLLLGCWVVDLVSESLGSEINVMILRFYMLGYRNIWIKT